MGTRTCPAPANTKNTRKATIAHPVGTTSREPVHLAHRPYALQLLRRSADDPDELVVVGQPLGADREGDPAREPVVQLIVRSGLQ